MVRMYEQAKPENRLEMSSNCPVCHSRAYETRKDVGFVIVCPVCGKFQLELIVGLSLASPSNRNDPLAYKISYNLRTIAERAEDREDESFFPVYSSEDFRRMREQPDLPIQEKLNLLLRHLAKLSKYPGQLVDDDFRSDYSVIGARNDEETAFYIAALQKRGMLSDVSYRDGLQFKIATEGWAELERIEQSGSQSANAFIAMSFNSSRKEFDTAIQDAINEAGYLPIRVDQVEHLNRIDDEMISRIRASKFMVADFSGHRPNVYFEAGFMFGLGRPVIALCEKKDIDDLHFDTRQYVMIDYEAEEDLKKRLKVRILANLGAGPHYVTPE